MLQFYFLFFFIILSFLQCGSALTPLVVMRRRRVRAVRGDERLTSPRPITRAGRPACRYLRRYHQHQPLLPLLFVFGVSRIIKR